MMMLLRCPQNLLLAAEPSASEVSHSLELKTHDGKPQSLLFSREPDNGRYRRHVAVGSDD